MRSQSRIRRSTNKALDVRLEPYQTSASVLFDISRPTESDTGPDHREFAGKRRPLTAVAGQSVHRGRHAMREQRV